MTITNTHKQIDTESAGLYTTKNTDNDWKPTDVFNANDGHSEKQYRNEWRKRRTHNESSLQKKKCLLNKMEHILTDESSAWMRKRLYNIQMNNNEFHNDTANTHYALIWLFKFSWSQKQKRPSYRQPDFTNDRAFCDNFLNWNETAIILLYLHLKKKLPRKCWQTNATHNQRKERISCSTQMVWL